MIKFGKYGALLICGSLLSACGSDSDDSDGSDVSTASDLSTGVFVDAAVGGVDYSTDTQQGTTNEKGEFDYAEGESVTFSIGDLVFPSVKAGDTITPLEIAGSTDINAPKVINMVRLLMSLDKDGDPSNGITITETAKASATVVDFELPIDEFATSDAVTGLVKNAGQDKPITELVTAEKAKEHFQETLDEIKENSTEYAEFAGMYDFSDHADGWGEIIVLYANGSYLNISYDTDPEYVEDNGMEYGDFDITEGTLTPTVKFDTNGGLGFSDVKLTNVSMSGSTLNITAIDDEETEEVKVDKAILSQSIMGSWSAENGGVSFNFMPDGYYYLAQLIDSEAEEGEAGEIGIEAGTYTFEDGLLSLSEPLMDMSGESLMNGEFGQSEILESTFSADNNTLTIKLMSNDSEEGEVTVEFTRKL